MTNSIWTFRFIAFTAVAVFAFGTATAEEVGDGHPPIVQCVSVPVTNSSGVQQYIIVCQINDGQDPFPTGIQNVPVDGLSLSAVPGSSTATAPPPSPQSQQSLPTSSDPSMTQRAH